MGLLTRLGTMFSRHPGASSQPADFDSAADADIIEGHPLDHLDDGPADGSSVVTTRPVNLARPTARRTKQEWFDELQRNHQELTDLIRKFDAHLDSTEQRAERLMCAADALDGLSPALDQLTRSIADQVVTAADRITGAIETASDRAESSANAARTDMADHLGQSNKAQVELITRMAEFRQSMTDVAQASAESSRLLAEISQRDSERYARVDQRLASVRVWIITGIALAFVLSVAAITISVIAITKSA